MKRHELEQLLVAHMDAMMEEVADNYNMSQIPMDYQQEKEYKKILEDLVNLVEKCTEINKYPMESLRDVQEWLNQVIDELANNFVVEKNFADYFYDNDETWKVFKNWPIHNIYRDRAVEYCKIHGVSIHEMANITIKIRWANVKLYNK